MITAGSVPALWSRWTVPWGKKKPSPGCSTIEEPGSMVADGAGVPLGAAGHISCPPAWVAISVNSPESTETSCAPGLVWGGIVAPGAKVTRPSSNARPGGALGTPLPSVSLVIPARGSVLGVPALDEADCADRVGLADVVGSPGSSVMIGSATGTPSLHVPMKRCSGVLPRATWQSWFAKLQSISASNHFQVPYQSWASSGFHRVVAGMS